MAKDSGVGAITHVGPVRLRVVGQGNLYCSVRSLDDVKIIFCPNSIAMQPTNDKEPHRLFNFSSQRMCFNFGTTVISEWFRIDKIVVFKRAVFAAHPR